MKKSQVIFDANALKKVMMKNLTEEQTRRLVAYAEDKIKEIGDLIQTYNSVNHMDRTGNLLDSLCWGVSYDGQLVEHGFYREKKAFLPSYLHEWSYAEWNDKRLGEVKASAAETVNGHELAEEYAQKYGNKDCNGWKVFFAILAPYWGYWEKGFTMKHPFDDSQTFTQFAVMTQFYDEVRRELKPAKVRFRISVAKYASKSLYSRAKREFYGR